MGKNKEQGDPVVHVRVLYEDLDRLERLSEFYTLPVGALARLAMRAGLGLLETEGEKFWQQYGVEMRKRGSR